MSENKPSASIAENSVLAKDKRGFPYKKVFFALLILIIVCSTILFVINLIINSYFKKVTVFDGIWSVDTEKMSSMEIYQDNRAYFMKNDKLHDVYHAALLNYAQATSDMKYDENVFNYAIFGTDQFEGSDEESSADIIMLVSVDKKNEKVTYLTFESRTLVYIPSVGVGPMTHAYMLGGPQLLANTLEQNYGVQLDGFIELNMSAFGNLVTAFGGVQVKGDKELVKEINGYIAEFDQAKGVSEENATEKVKLTKDVIKLNGQQALAYLRKAGDKKASLANNILSQVTTKIYDNGISGIMSTLDIALEKMMVSMVRDDVGALILIGVSVFDSIKTVPVGNMEGREVILGGSAVTCNYQAERAAIVSALYQ